MLESLRLMKPAEVLRETVRGQYGPGMIKGKKGDAHRNDPTVADVHGRDLRGRKTGRR